MVASALDLEAPAYFQDNGYWLHRKPVLSEAQFSKLRSLFEELLSNRGTKRGDELDVPHFSEPRLFEFLLADEVLDLVEPLIGPNIGLWSSHFISKEPYTGRATPWHTDADYWEGRFDQFGSIVTIWLAIDRADKENGCMKVIPGTHKSGAEHEYGQVDADTNLFATAIKAEEIDDAKAVYFELDPNQCSLHDSRIVHGAEANTSARRRCGYTMRYFSQEMKFLHEAPHNAGHRIWHCRGRNIANNRVENG